jgi:hypothetical protein
VTKAKHSSVDCLSSDKAESIFAFVERASLRGASEREHMLEGRKSISLEKEWRRRWNTKRFTNTARDNFGFVSSAHAKQAVQ